MNDVITFDGTPAKRSDCRYIKGEYFIKNKQCFYINDKWFRISSKFITFDHENKNYVHIDYANQYLINGIVKLLPSIEFGYFTPNPYNNIFVPFLDKVLINVDLCNFNNPFYTISNNVVVKVGNPTGMKVTRYENIPYNYNSSDTMYMFDNTKSTSYYKSLFDLSYNKLNHSYGIEYETANGTIPESFCLRYGLIPLKDGSLRTANFTPYEYATIPLQNHEVFNVTKKHTELLNQYCEINHKASLHIHQGHNVNNIDKEYIIAYYILVTNLQKEIFSLFPSFVARSSTVGKDKDYCKPLPAFKTLLNAYTDIGGNTIANNTPFNFTDSNINLLYSAIYYFLEGSVLDPDISINNLGLKESHALNPNNNYKWHINSRYYICNFIPLIFSNKRTIEWRLHTSTFNFTKISNFIMMIETFANFVHTYKREIINNEFNHNLDLSLMYILRKSLPLSKYEYLMSYIKWRQDKCINYTYSKSLDNSLSLYELATNGLNDKIDDARINDNNILLF